MYPIIKGIHIIEQLRKRAEHDEKIQFILSDICSDEGSLVCEILPAVRVTGRQHYPGVSGKSFIVYATRLYKVSRGMTSESQKFINRFDTVEVQNADGSISLMKIMAILSFRCRRGLVTRRRIMLLAARLSVVEKSSSDQYCPLTLTSFEYFRQLWLELVDLRQVVSPVSCFFDPDHKPLRRDEGKSLAEVRKYRFWVMSPRMYYKCKRDFPMSRQDVETFFSLRNEDVTGRTFMGEISKFLIDDFGQVREDDEMMQLRVVVEDGAVGERNIDEEALNKVAKRRQDQREINADEDVEYEDTDDELSDD